MAVSRLRDIPKKSAKMTLCAAMRIPFLTVNVLMVTGHAKRDHVTNYMYICHSCDKV